MTCQVAGQTEHQRKVSCKISEEECTQGHPGVGGMCRIMQGREAALRGHRGPCRLECQRRMGTKWSLMAEGKSSHGSGQCSRSLSLWLSTALPLELLKRSHDCTGDTLKLRCVSVCDTSVRCVFCDPGRGHG